VAGSDSAVADDVLGLSSFFLHPSRPRFKTLNIVGKIENTPAFRVGDVDLCCRRPIAGIK